MTNEYDAMNIFAGPHGGGVSASLEGQRKAMLRVDAQDATLVGGGL
jgi:hypothetical protein